ncbi:MAG TPA: hypothetical protein VN894_14415 [Polyangiaceae bacterium]|nr:hypothetical protein [Polyangiaceae bacterium]
MSMNRRGPLLVVFAAAATLPSCTLVTPGTEGSDPPPPAASDNGGSSSGATQPAQGASASVQNGMLGFTASNVPAATSFPVPGDWVFSSQTCSSTNVQIDTAKGTVNGCDPTMQAFSYTAITQSDTSLGSLPAALFVTNKFTIETGMTVTVVGNLPLIVVALDDANISGLLDASRGVGGGGISSRGNQKGNGQGGGGAATGGSGAGGAGFCGMGGDGASNTGSGGRSYGNASNIPFLGGSAGGSAGQYSGAGGGAVQIVSATSVEVTAPGVVHVGGAGGNWGGSAGGSGGAILLEAPLISIAGTLAANGGGGGGGDGFCNNGQDGQQSAMPAAGDKCKANPGGTGAAGLSIDGSTPASGMLGGAGGAAGRIRLNTTGGAATIGSTAVISPAPSTTCATQGMIGQ